MTRQRNTPIDINKEDFKRMAYSLIDDIADFMETLDEKPVTTGESPLKLQAILGNSSLPEKGTLAETLLSKTSKLLINHSLFNAHPKFMGYITSSPAPIGLLGDLLAASVNQNVGAQILSPMATEIEKQTIKWLAQFIGVSGKYGGILVSGGNMANFTAFLAARTAMAPKNFKEEGIKESKKLITYCSSTTHTWVDKAATLFGHGSNSIRWIPTDSLNKIDVDLLQEAITKDLKEGHQPFLVVGTAGDVSTGVVDDLKAIGKVCKRNKLWFHIDGAYGIPAAVIPELATLFEGINEADSLALDPHKWLYSPLEAGCTLVKNPKHLIDTYSSHPEYYNFSKDEQAASQNFYEYGLQNSRGFRALKVWLALQQVGRQGYIEMIGEDIDLSKLLFDLADKHSELQAVTQNLSITTLRYVPLNRKPDDQNDEVYLNTLNEALLDRLQQGGEVFLSNAIVKGNYCLRACIVNFRTSEKDIKEIVSIIIGEGKKIHRELQKKQQ